MIDSPSGLLQHLEGIRVGQGLLWGECYDSAGRDYWTEHGWRRCCGYGTSSKAIVVGNPAKIVGYTDTLGMWNRLDHESRSVAPG